MVDTSVLLAGISGFKSGFQPANASATILRDWTERGHFTWLLSEDILGEYKAVLARRRVRPQLIGRIINLLREEAEHVHVRRIRGLSPDPGDNSFCACAEEGGADFIVTLNKRDFPEAQLAAKVIVPGEVIPITKRVRRKRNR